MLKNSNQFHMNTYVTSSHHSLFSAGHNNTINPNNPVTLELFHAARTIQYKKK